MNKNHFIVFLMGLGLQLITASATAQVWVPLDVGSGVITWIPAGPALDPGAKTFNYFYDNLGRLQEVRYSNGSKIVYSYDAAGNRTMVVTSPPP